jgi:hypothetical protein
LTTADPLATVSSRDARPGGGTYCHGAMELSHLRCLAAVAEEMSDGEAVD